MGIILHMQLVSSRSLRLCSEGAQDRFHRYLLAADNWGVFEMNLQHLKGLLWRYRNDMQPHNIQADLKEYAKWGMLFVYSVGGKPYGYLANWERFPHFNHSRRGKKEYPMPRAEDVDRYLAQTEPIVASRFAKLEGLEEMTQAQMFTERPALTLESESTEREPGPKLRPDKIVTLWNEVCGKAGLPPVIELTSARRRKLSMRIAEHGEEATWGKVIEKISRSTFCRGNSSRGWRATLDWLIKSSDSLTRVLEGQYDDAGPSVTKVPEVRKDPVTGKEYRDCSICGKAEMVVIFHDPQLGRQYRQVEHDCRRRAR